MNVKQLQEIIRLFEDSSLTELEAREGDDYVRMRRGTGDSPQAAAAPALQATAVPAQRPSAETAKDPGPDFNNIIEVKSPVVGVYYEASEPGGKPFVQVGDRVKKGDTLCLVEVMKQVTEVTAPQDGQVADILPANGTVVEFGQTLIKLF